MRRISGVKPGSHMPPIYLGHRHGICEHLSPNHNLSQALTTGHVQARRRLLAIKIILCEHRLRTQSTPVRRFDPYLQVEWLKLLQFDLHSRKFGFVGDPSQIARDPLEQIADRCNRRLRRR